MGIVDEIEKSWWHKFDKFRNEEWERIHSSLYHKKPKAKYSKCVEYAKRSIAKATHLDINPKKSVVEITNPYFHGIGRVNTSMWGDSTKEYYRSFLNRDFISFSTVSKDNVSRYKNKPFFLYNLVPDDIVHIFPMDSDTDCNATDLRRLSGLPSIWLDINDLEIVKKDLGVYDQITCRTKRDGEIIKPIAVLALDTITDQEKRMSYAFEVPIALCHPEENAHRFFNDVLMDKSKLGEVSSKMRERYGLDTSCMGISL